MRQDEPTRPIHVPRLRTVDPTADRELPSDEEPASREALALDRETEPLPKIDPTD